MADDDFELHRARRSLFGAAVESYAEGRPGYPDRVFEVLVDRCALGPGSRVLEVGAGTGQATSRLLDLGANVTVVELGEPLVTHLAARFPGAPLTFITGAFEETTLPPHEFDIVAAATSFHWVPTEDGLRQAARALRVGGWLALWWNVFGDPDRPDPFHDALVPVLEQVAPTLVDAPSAGNAGVGAPLYAIDSEARSAEIERSGYFGPVDHEIIAWTGRHSPAELRSLFASFSPWLALPAGQRADALDALEELARGEFGGVVERPYLTPIYVAPRLP